MSLTLFEPKVSRVRGREEKRGFKYSRATAGCRRDVDESAMFFPHVGKNLRRPCAGHTCRQHVSIKFRLKTSSRYSAPRRPMNTGQSSLIKTESHIDQPNLRFCCLPAQSSREFLRKNGQPAKCGRQLRDEFDEKK